MGKNKVTFGKTSVKRLIMLPVMILGIVSILSNVVGLRNIQKVNNQATLIADDYMENMSQLNNIQEETAEIYRLALSHIIATDFNAMIDIVDTIKVKEADLDQLISDYGAIVSADDQESYQQLQENYANFKHAVVNVVAYSANSKTSDAYAFANGYLAIYGNQMQENIDNIFSNISAKSDLARNHLNQVYNASLLINMITILISILSIGYALIRVIRGIINPIRATEKEITGIIADIENRQGDLTRRVTIANAKEVGELGHGINTFMEKLQHIFLVLTKDSRKMDIVVNEVLHSVHTSNDSAADLSALTEELSATMQEVSSNASLITDNVDAVKSEVSVIAEKSNELNAFSKEMKQHAKEMEHNARNNMETTSAKISEIVDILNQAIEESNSVDQVNTLTNDILNISSQTNLLALNASIEAARAGEAGKGFAVVADEIRALSERTRQETENISHILEALEQNANETAKTVGRSVEVGTTQEEMIRDVAQQFTEMNANVDNLVSNISVIEKMLGDLSNANTEIVNNITSLSASTEEVTASAQQSSELTDQNLENSQNAKAILDDVLQVSHRMDKYISHDMF